MYVSDHSCSIKATLFIRLAISHTYLMTLHITLFILMYTIYLLSLYQYSYTRYGRYLMDIH